MNKKAIIFTFLLTGLLFSGCGVKNTPESDGPITDSNNTTEISPIIDMNTMPESMIPTDNMEPQDDISSDINNSSTNASDTANNNNDVSNTNSTLLTEQEAKQIVLQKIPGATEDNIKKFKKDTDDTIVEYEGEIHYDGTEYEFEIHAYDGTILEWDEEPLREIAH